MSLGCMVGIHPSSGPAEFGGEHSSPAVIVDHVVAVRRWSEWRHVLPDAEVAFPARLLANATTAQWVMDKADNGHCHRIKLVSGAAEADDLGVDTQPEGTIVGEVSYKGHRYPAEIIAHCGWLYHRFPLSFREVEELMVVRGVIVTYETIRQWCAKFGPVYAAGLRRRQPRPGDKWHLDEVFLTITGRRHYLWRAVDQDGNVLDILV